MSVNPGDIHLTLKKVPSKLGRGLLIIHILEMDPIMGRFKYRFNYGSDIHSGDVVYLRSRNNYNCLNLEFEKDFYFA